MKTLFTILAFLLFINAKAQFINTLAGTGVAGYGGDGGLALTATFNQPVKVCADVAGNVYIGDCLNHCVRKISAGGVVTTIAGTGTDGFSGDGGPAISAKLDSPAGVYADAAGNVYIADAGNNRIRKIDAGGLISTVAGSGATGFGNGSYSGDGGQAGAATLNGPFCIVKDANGNMFILDRENHCIRKVGANGVISTVAGNGIGGYSGDGGQATAAKLSSPSGMALDASGNLYIADADNNRIRKVNTMGVITTVAGTGSGGFTGDGGPATSAQLDYPFDVDIDASGNMYIVDSNNFRIRKTDASGIITTIAGNGNFAHSGDGGLATAAACAASGLDYLNGKIYIAEPFGNGIRLICSHAVNSPTSITICAGTTATLIASGATTYMWSNLETGSTIVVSPATSTEYFAQGRDSDGCVSNNRISLTVSSCLGIEERSNNGRVTIYPNPASEILTIEFADAGETRKRPITIYDIFGNPIKINASETTANCVRIYVGGLKSGIYFLKIGNTIEKFVKE